MRKIDIDSETARELDPELSRWAGQLKTNMILADIFDMLAMINSNIVAMGSRKKATKPKSYPRYGDKDKKKIGKGALPPDELKEWFAKKRIENKNRN